MRAPSFRVLEMPSVPACQMCRVNEQSAALATQRAAEASERLAATGPAYAGLLRHAHGMELLALQYRLWFWLLLAFNVGFVLLVMLRPWFASVAAQAIK